MLVCELFSLASFSTNICGLNVLLIFLIRPGTTDQNTTPISIKPFTGEKYEAHKTKLRKTLADELKIYHIH